MGAEAEGLTISEFAREAGVKPSFITQLINDKRIPEAVRDDSGHYRMPSRRCVIPSKHPRRNGKINACFFRRDEIPVEWIQDESTRPGTLDESGHFVGVSLEGDEKESLASRVEKTFGVTVGRPEPTGSTEAVPGTSAQSLEKSVNGVDKERWREIGIDLDVLRRSGMVDEITVRFARNGGSSDFQTSVSVFLSE